MLHIERKVGESIRLGTDIHVIVTKAANGTVRLAFEAPKEVKIYREEIYQRIQNEKTPCSHSQLFDFAWDHRRRR